MKTSLPKQRGEAGAVLVKLGVCGWRLP